MKTPITCFWICLISLIAFSQEKPVKIVFDVTSDNTKVHQATVRHVKAMSQAYPDSQFEVVMYGGAIDMVLKDKSVVAEDIAKLIQKDNIDFVICGGTMKRHNTKDSDLIKGIKQVPDGIMEIVNRQKDGWGYIKESQ
ncbi:DsrE family protein [Aestuariibaculum suncheonense]|uniref:DsrE family protein n=1 Tax=Aestuariibaculum suncheonense TaxID=1028745 RepID=A0A8J6QGL7_9FLAO|nr:DsrE family protein [Aestuariibaculum suncheonense]MBD0835146.1 DsrE family protein [Aestuariibaculum suncheonense]